MLGRTAEIRAFVPARHAAAIDLNLPDITKVQSPAGEVLLPLQASHAQPVPGHHDGKDAGTPAGLRGRWDIALGDDSEYAQSVTLACGLGGP